MPKQLVCQNREESAVGTTLSMDRVAINQSSQRPNSKPATASHRLGSFAFQPYQLFNPTPYATKHKATDCCDDVISNGSNHSKSSDSKELPINLMTSNNKVERMSICNVSSETRQLPNSKPLSPPSSSSSLAVQKTCHPPITTITHVPSPVTTNVALSRSTHHLGSSQPNSVVPQIKLPPTSMYPYSKQQTSIDNISPPTHIIQPLPPLPSINSMRSLVAQSPKVHKQGFASPKTKAKKGLTAHLTTNNFSAVVNSGSNTKSFGSSTSTTQNFYASPMKSVDNSNPYTISSLTTSSTTQNENVDRTNIMNNTTPNQTPEKKEAPPTVKPIPKLPFGTLSLMN
ncbi:predicted protein [Naegleria gruberi]|uniref:Predicted protein n=1 Tax=Naegleria gruberi TaxID=5762 RepID=D2VHM2_NAEGR|nr:uncharacterized protein NAEGRDRAFT_58240 [Naegleria gruberi]EFC43612.1 predicted protein [Naegleria gruberi]|eukprot:XP_002676356.1 predicted protein [Naegleria gruberi strain NEG-M]